MNSFNYTINQAKYEDIEKHLLQCSKLFSPALDTYVSIPDYSKKIRYNAVTVEAWYSDELIGLVACYLNNDRTHEGYITNVSVINVYQGKGIAKKLIKNTIEEALNKNYKTLNLEVEVNNKWAIELYRRSGFVLNGRTGSKYLMINRLLENKDVLVSICCVTYNHVNYIRDAIESFLMQKTDFPIEILIHDDSSTDGTAEIIREYEEKHPDIIKPILQKENQYSKGKTISATYQFPRALGKYIAMCEGDDYWSDPYKLQKQVDSLKSDLTLGLIHTDADVKNEKTGNRIKNYYKNLHIKIPEKNILDNIFLARYPIFTCSTLFRRELLDKIDFSLMPKFVAGDYFLWINFAQITKFSFLAESTCVRRILHESVTQSSNLNKLLNFWVKDYEMYKYFLSKNLVHNSLQSKVHWIRGERILDIFYRMGDALKFRSFYQNLKENYGSHNASIEYKLIFMFSDFDNGFIILSKSTLLQLLKKVMNLYRRYCRKDFN